MDFRFAKILEVRQERKTEALLLFIVLNKMCNLMLWSVRST